MESQNSQEDTPIKSKIPRNIVISVGVLIALIALNYHIKNPVLVYGGAIAVVLIHLAIVGGLAHIVPALRKRFQGE